MQFTLPQWYDLHAHFRQGDFLEPLVREHKRMGCAGALAMPNTKPPVAVVLARDENPQAWSIETYLGAFRQAWPEALDLIVPLYLTAATTAEMIKTGAESGLLRACKYYPPHGTTNAEHGKALHTYMANGVFAAMQDHGIVLCIHGETPNLNGENYFGKSTNAEDNFYRTEMPQLVRAFPRLKIVAEHITTKTAADFVQQASGYVTASVTPQHLLYTIGDLLQGLKYHLYCLPLVKYEEDRQALCAAVTSTANTRFFAGTDSAPHTTKATACGCAAGCFTGGSATQLYASAFEKAGVDMASKTGQEIFKQFLCLNGPAFYGLKIPTETFTLSKAPQEICLIKTKAGILTPLSIGLQPQAAEKATLDWCVT